MFRILSVFFQPSGASGLGPLSRVFLLLAFINLFQCSELLLFNLTGQANILIVQIRFCRRDILSSHFANLSLSNFLFLLFQKS